MTRTAGDAGGVFLSALRKHNLPLIAWDLPPRPPRRVRGLRLGVERSQAPGCVSFQLVSRSYWKAVPFRNARREQLKIALVTAAVGDRRIPVEAGLITDRELDFTGSSRIRCSPYLRPFSISDLEFAVLTRAPLEILTGNCTLGQLFTHCVREFSVPIRYWHYGNFQCTQRSGVAENSPTCIV